MLSIKWNKFTKILKNGKRIILANRYNGQWIKISKECYKVIDEAIKRSYSSEDLLSCINDVEDFEYFKKLLGVLFESELIVLKQPERKDLSVDFAITNRCNLSCTHCCVEADVYTKDSLSTDEIYSILAKIISLNPKSICITGGEPLIRNDFIEILTFLGNNFDGEIRLMTNATLINEKNVNVLSKYVSAVDISIDGVDEETCSKIRGTGVFDKVIKNIKLLQNNGITEISLSMVLTKSNYKLRKEFIELNKKIGTRAVVRAFSPIGRGKTNATFLLPSEEEKEFENARFMKKTADDCHICSCGALIKEIYINQIGDIFPCGLLERQKYRLGNVKNIQDLNTFIYFEKYMNSEGYKNWLELQPENHEFCKECEVNLFCWGCLHYLDLLENNKQFFLKDCFEMREHLKKLAWEE